MMNKYNEEELPQKSPRERALWAAVLLRAIRDYRSGGRFERIDPIEGDCLFEVTTWFLDDSTESYEVGGFHWVCQQLWEDEGMVQVIRQKILGVC